MKKIIPIVAILAVVLAAGVAIATISYTHSDAYTGNKLPERVIINGVDCSGLTYEDAQDRLTDSRNSQHLQVVGKLGETLGDYTDFGCKYDIRSELESLKRDHPVAAGISHYLHIPFETSIAMKVEEPGIIFKTDVTTADFLNRDGITDTQDAYVDLEDPTFPVVPEVYGNRTDTEAYFKDIEHAVAMGQTKFEFDENAYLTVPKVKRDDPELLKYQTFCRKYLGQQISYKLGDKSFTLTAKELDSLMNDDLSGNADEQKVSEFVADMKAKYDISDGQVEFTSLTGKKCKVGLGDHGWVIDQAGETAQLVEDINSHKDVKRDPVFSQKGIGEYSDKLNIGDTYVEVDITAQHAYYFLKGKLKWDTDVVTGCVALGHNTPTGVFDIKSKNRGVTLKGGKKGKPGYYESYVSYWMAFLGTNYGLHDASWRSSFGGSIYKTNGSHGCVNLPPPKAGELYDQIQLGTIVIIHN